MDAKFKKVKGEPRTYIIEDCENPSFVGKKIIIEVDKQCFRGALNLSQYYDLNTAGDLWTFDGRLVGYWEEI